MGKRVYHVTTLKKLQRYTAKGCKMSRTNAWLDIDSAERFAEQTGRKVILRLTFDEEHTYPMDGHKNNAVFTDSPILFPRDVV